MEENAALWSSCAEGHGGNVQLDEFAVEELRSNSVEGSCVEVRTGQVL